MSNYTITPPKTINQFKKIISMIPQKAYIHLQAANDFVIPENWGFTNRINTNYHLAFIKSGNGHYYYHHHSDSFKTGKLYFIGKGCIHSRFLDKTQLPRVVLLRFEIRDNQTHTPLKDLPDNTAFSFMPQKLPLYYDLFEQLFFHYSKKNASSQTICQIIISQLVHEIYNEMIDNEIAQPIDNRIERVARHIRNNFTQNLNLNKLISISGLSRNYFFKLFSKYYKTTPKQYQIQLRINYAITYLNETSISIRELADKLGYQDQFCFSKQFKQVVGFSPTAFRKSYIESKISLSSKD